MSNRYTTAMHNVAFGAFFAMALTMYNEISTDGIRLATKSHEDYETKWNNGRIEGQRQFDTIREQQAYIDTLTKKMEELEKRRWF
jgi:hypothetical protein